MRDSSTEAAEAFIPAENSSKKQSKIRCSKKKVPKYTGMFLLATMYFLISLEFAVFAQEGVKEDTGPMWKQILTAASSFILNFVILCFFTQAAIDFSYKILGRDRHSRESEQTDMDLDTAQDSHSESSEKRVSSLRADRVIFGCAIVVAALSVVPTISFGRDAVEDSDAIRGFGVFGVILLPFSQFITRSVGAAHELSAFLNLLMQCRASAKNGSQKCDKSAVTHSLVILLQVGMVYMTFPLLVLWLEKADQGLHDIGISNGVVSNLINFPSTAINMLFYSNMSRRFSPAVITLFAEAYKLINKRIAFLPLKSVTAVGGLSMFAASAYLAYLTGFSMSGEMEQVLDKANAGQLATLANATYTNPTVQAMLGYGWMTPDQSAALSRAVVGWINAAPFYLMVAERIKKSNNISHAGDEAGDAGSGADRSSTDARSDELVSGGGGPPQAD